MKILLLVLLVGIGLLLGVAYWGMSKKSDLTLVPISKMEKTNIQTGNGVGVGWSVNDDPKAAVNEAVVMAKQRMGQAYAPKYAYVLYTVGYDSGLVRNTLQSVLPQKIKIQGLTSSVGVMTNEGLHKGKVGSVAVMLIGAEGFDFGVAGVDITKYKTPQEVGKAVVQNAIRDAGRTEKDIPQMIIFNGTPRRGDDMEILDGVASVVGKGTVVMGGTAGNDTNDPTWRQFTRTQEYVTGLVVTVVYTQKKIGWAFDSELKMTDKSGLVTKSEGKTIYEIDGKSALDTYNLWIGGGLKEKIASLESVELYKYTALYPFGRIIRGDQGQVGYYTLHPVPSKDDLKNGTLSLAGTIPQGSEIKLLAGTWQTFLNRAESIPRKAFIRGAMDSSEALFGVMVLCRGAAYSLPTTELPKVPLITNNIVKGMPFIGVISRGEQGPLEGIRNVNANLVESMVVFGK